MCPFRWSQSFQVQHPFTAATACPYQLTLHTSWQLFLLCQQSIVPFGTLLKHPCHDPPKQSTLVECPAVWLCRLLEPKSC